MCQPSAKRRTLASKKLPPGQEAEVLGKLRLQTHAFALWEAFLVLGAKGKLWYEYAGLNAALQSEYQDLTLERLNQFATTT